MPRIGLLCFSAIPDDPRVRRQGDLLHDAGYEVVAVGLPGARSPAPRWKSVFINDPCDHSPLEAANAAQFERKRKKYNFSKKMISSIKRVISVFQRAEYRLRRSGDLARVLVDSAHALNVYWKLNNRFTSLYDLASKQDVDLWIANDWTTLPIAIRLRDKNGSPFIYDTHELAIDEYAHNLKWRFTQRPIIVSIERTAISKAEFVTCVSNGIANRLHDFYNLKNRPTVIRNMPQFIESAFRPTGSKIRILYHGVVSRGRGLEECIASVALWKDEFDLTIRGPSDPTYLESLREIATRNQVVNRVFFLPPVPMTDLISEASIFDVGLFVIEGYSEQNIQVLPNKFFEYCMAGLALCVSNLPEMRALLDRFSLGLTIDAPTPQSIASTINTLNAEKIDRFKKKALAAARELCWEKEGIRIIELIRQIT
jgi:glycosyltransferase involved in cell wall biosynthesis